MCQTHTIRRVIVLILFFLSGVASLVLETVFRRELVLYVGSAVTATSITLATFLGGLALGAALFGKIADRTERPLRLYALLELGVGASGAIAVLLLAYGREWLLVPVRHAAGFGPVVAALVAALLLLPPTILMGGTLPALTRFAMRKGRTILAPLAVLYGVNTLGASLGAALSGFVLFESVGVSGSGWLACGLALAVGAVALVVDARQASYAGLDAGGHRAAKRADVPTHPSRRTALVVATLGGAVALGYEVVWTRLLVLPLRSYAYSFSLMLSLFLLGLVVGSLLLSRMAGRIERPLAVLGIVQLASGAYVAASVAWIPYLLAPPSEGGGFAALVATAFLRAGPVVIPPTVLSGMALPLAVLAFAPDPDAPARAVGAVYAANTIGAIVGALAAGLVLLPMLGASRALAALAILGAGAGALATRRRLAVPVVVACAIALFLPVRPFTEAYSRAGRSRAAPSDALFYEEGANDTVAVVRRDYGFRDADAKSVLVNGIAMTATVKPVWRYMAAEGHLPALLAPAPSRALVICVGTGITLGALASHDTVASIDAVDLSESMLAALPVFDRENRAVRRDPKVHFVQADGRHLLDVSGHGYNLITLEPPPPIVAGSVHLYTLDFYRLCKARLDPGGVVAQWLPLHAQSLASAQAMARTFLGAFPHAQLWLPSIRDAVLIGSDRPLTLDPARLAAAYAAPATRASLAAAYFETPQALLGTYLLDRAGIERWSAGADVVTDDRPHIEFFRRYGRTMPDAEIATLLAPPPGSVDDVCADPALRPAVEAERLAHRMYLQAEIDKDPAAYREAALTTRATRFGLYRLGCDQPQLDALRNEPDGGAAYQKQLDLCRRMTAGAQESSVTPTSPRDP